MIQVKHEQKGQDQSEMIQNLHYKLAESDKHLKMTLDRLHQEHQRTQALVIALKQKEAQVVACLEVAERTTEHLSKIQQEDEIWKLGKFDLEEFKKNLAVLIAIRNDRRDGPAGQVKSAMEEAQKLLVQNSAQPHQNRLNSISEKSHLTGEGQATEELDVMNSEISGRVLANVQSAATLTQNQKERAQAVMTIVGEAERMADEQLQKSEKKYVYNENVSLFSPGSSRGNISPSPHSQV